MVQRSSHTRFARQFKLVKIDTIPLLHLKCTQGYKAHFPPQVSEDILVSITTPVPETQKATPTLDNLKGLPSVPNSLVTIIPSSFSFSLYDSILVRSMSSFLSVREPGDDSAVQVVDSAVTVGPPIVDCIVETVETDDRLAIALVSIHL